MLQALPTLTMPVPELVRAYPEPDQEVRAKLQSGQMSRGEMRAMAPLKPVWDDRRLAIVHACGSPDTTRSHFDAQDYMESGTPGVKSTQDGWLAHGLQAVHATPASPFRAVAMGSSSHRRSGETWAPSLWARSPTST